MVLASGVQRRPWGLGVALALQVATIACGLLVPALALVGLIFAAVWAGILLMARDVRRRYARGELPAQVAARTAADRAAAEASHSRSPTRVRTGHGAVRGLRGRDGPSIRFPGD